MITGGQARSSSGPREVLHFVSTFQVKTDTKWLLRLARHLASDAWRLSVACFYEGGPMKEAFEALGLRTYNLDSPCGHDPRAILRAKRLIKNLRPDIVHTHLLRADLLGGLAARWAGVPVILSTVYGVGGFRREKKRKLDYLLDLACAALPTHVLAVADAVKRDCVGRLGMNPADVSVIHTGVDPPDDVDMQRAAALRREWQVGEDQPLILSLARLSYEKGLDTLIDAAAIVHQTHPQARFVVLGNGPDRLGLEVRIRIKELIRVVKLAGFQEDVWPALAAADIFCMPSKSEGMPNALLEAMTSGTPIVATTAGGIPEAVRHDHSALLVEPDNPRTLAAALVQLIDMSAEGGSAGGGKPDARRFAEAAQQTILEKFLARDVARRYAALYETLLADRMKRSCGGAEVEGDPGGSPKAEKNNKEFAGSASFA